jgi:hypothetical protein
VIRGKKWAFQSTTGIDEMFDLVDGARQMNLAWKSNLLFFCEVTVEGLTATDKLVSQEILPNHPAIHVAHTVVIDSLA